MNMEQPTFNPQNPINQPQPNNQQAPLDAALTDPTLEEEKATSKRRIFWLFVVISLIFTAVLIFEIVELIIGVAK